MSKFNIPGLINTFSQLGKWLTTPDDGLMEIINNERRYNAWFTPESVLQAVTAIGKMLNEEELSAWANKYDTDQNAPAKKVGLILAGNIPLVGFHDILCVLVSGNTALIKVSSQDDRIIKYVLQKLVEIDENFSDRFSFVDRLENFDAIIATGSNNTSRYFDYYFGKVPNIIRKNRNSIALLTGNETTEQLFALGHDIFDHYGLGCRNVSKLFVPKGYDIVPFFEAIEPFNPIIHHHKYNNNYDYNKSIYLVNSDKHFDNGFLLLKEDVRLASPLAVLYYEYYNDLKSVEDRINELSDQVQCIVSVANLNTNAQVVNFGESQHPRLWDHADGIDTMEFLSDLKITISLGDGQ